MNCRRFQNDLYEYLDGSLSPGARAAAERHLAECAVCRQRLAQEQEVERSFSHTFRRATERLELPPSAGRHVLAELAREASGTRRAEAQALWWHRLAWPLALAGSLLLVLGGWALLLRGAWPGVTRPQQHVAERVVSVQLSYVVPTYTFRREDGHIVDALITRPTP